MYVCVCVCVCVCLCVCVCVCVPVVFSIPHVPGRGVTDDLDSGARLHEHGVGPEAVVHLVEAHRHEELLRLFEETQLLPLLEGSQEVGLGVSPPKTTSLNCFLNTLVNTLHTNFTEGLRVHLLQSASLNTFSQRCF